MPLLVISCEGATQQGSSRHSLFGKWQHGCSVWQHALPLEDAIFRNAKNICDFPMLSVKNAYSPVQVSVPNRQKVCAGYWQTKKLKVEDNACLRVRLALFSSERFCVRKEKEDVQLDQSR